MTNDKPAPSCRLCGSVNLDLSIDLGSQPIAHRLLDRVEREFAHPLTMHICRDCGLGQIVKPIDPEILYRDYNYCFSSWKPEPHRDVELATIDAYKPKGSVFEIGCNDGLFLAELKKRGHASCVGLEPNTVAHGIAEGRGLTVYGSFLDEQTCDSAIATHGRFDLVVARQVLEHVSDIPLFFRCVDRLLLPDGRVFIDVPNVGPGLTAGDCTILWEEHVNYFTDEVLKRTFDRFGFVPVWTEKFNYSGGTLAFLSRRKSSSDAPAPGKGTSMAEDFGARVVAYGDNLRTALAEAKSRFDQVVLYGVGCRACTLVNGLRLKDRFDFAIDDQKERQGKLMPGSHLQIKGPGVVAETRKALVILAVNQENEMAVKGRLQALCPNTQLVFLSALGPNRIADDLEAFRKAHL